MITEWSLYSLLVSISIIIIIMLQDISEYLASENLTETESNLSNFGTIFSSTKWVANYCVQHTVSVSKHLQLHVSFISMLDYKNDTLSYGYYFFNSKFCWSTWTVYCIVRKWTCTVTFRLHSLMMQYTFTCIGKCLQLKVMSNGTWSLRP